MIAIQKADGRYRPVVVCDQCGRAIDDAFGATAVASAAPEGTTAQAFHVHKGACDRDLASRLDGLAGSEELAVHLIELLRNSLERSERQRVENLMKWSDPDG